MPREPTRNQVNNGLEYQKQVPKFLQNFGKPAPSRSPPPEHHPNYRASESSRRTGREAIPERPREGKWAAGSDDEDDRSKQRQRDMDSDDEWGDVYGGGGEEGPQVVVLKEGRHLSADEVKRERRRVAGKSSRSPSPDKSKQTAKSETVKKADEKVKPVIPKNNPSSSKRKLVGGDDTIDTKATSVTEGKKKKKKAVKGLLSFDEAEGEA